MKKNIKTLFLLFSLLSVASTANANDVKTLTQLLHQADSAYSNYNYNLSLQKSEKALSILKENKIEWKDSLVYKVLTINLESLYNIGEIDECIEKGEKNLSEGDLISREPHISNIKTFLGLVYRDKGDISQAMQHFNSAYDYYQNNDLNSAASTLNNIGLLYASIKEYDEAINLHHQALEIYKNLPSDQAHKTSIINSMNNIGFCYYHKYEGDSALFHYRAAYDLVNQIDDNFYRAILTGNIGNVYNDMNELDSALFYLNKSYEYLILIKKENFTYVVYNDIAAVHLKKGNLDEALEYGLKANGGLIKFKLIKDLSGNHKVLSEIYAAKNNYQKAYNHHVEHKTLVDSLGRESNERTLIRQSLKFEFEKKQLLLEATKNEEILQANSKARQRTLVSYGLGGGIFLLVIFSFILSNKMRKIKSKNRLIEKQKLSIQEHSDELIKIQEEKHNLELKNKQHDLELLNANNKLKAKINTDIIHDISTVLSQQDVEKNLKSLLADLKLQTSSSEKIQVLHDGINEVDNSFVERLKSICPALSKTEREVCSYIKLHLSVKEIASIRKTSANSIRVTRHRIKSKLELSDSIELESYIESL